MSGEAGYVWAYRDLGPRLTSLRVHLTENSAREWWAAAYEDDPEATVHLELFALHLVATDPEPALATCESCAGTRWVDDENWFPEHEGERARGRVPGSGRIPCGSCNFGGWDVDEVAPALSFTEQEVDRNADQACREASQQAAKRKVDSLPADHRRYLEGEFQRTEQEAATIMRHGRREAATYELPDDADRCADLTKSPRGWLQCQLPAGHEADPRSFHHVDPAGPVLSEAGREARGES